MMEMVVTMVVSSIFMVGLITAYFSTVRVIATAKEQADAGTLITNLSEVLVNEIAYAYYDHNGVAGNINVQPDFISFSKTDKTSVVIKSSAVPFGSSSTIDVMMINDEPVFDTKFYGGCSLDLAFSLDEDSGVIVVGITLSGKATYASEISVKPLNYIKPVVG